MSPVIAESEPHPLSRVLGTIVSEHITKTLVDLYSPPELGRRISSKTWWLQLVFPQERIISKRPFDLEKKIKMFQLVLSSSCP